MEKNELQQKITNYENWILNHKKDIETKYKQIEGIEVQRQKLNDELLEIQRGMGSIYAAIADKEEILEELKSKLK